MKASRSGSRTAVGGVALALALVMGLACRRTPSARTPEPATKTSRSTVTGRERGAKPAATPLPSSAKKPYDKPRERLAFAARKRAPVGERAIPTERYRVAQEQAAEMPTYSTREGRFGAPEGRSRSGAQAAAAPALPNIGTWGKLGPGNIGGRTRALVIDPSDTNKMFAGAVAGGVWKTTNGGSAWTPVGSGETGMANLAVSSLAMKPGDSNTLLAGTGEGHFNFDAVRGAGIFKTTDGGTNWTPVASPGTGLNKACELHYVNDIVYSTLSSNRAYAATGYSSGCDSNHTGGVYRTDNGGSTWTRILSVTVDGGCLDLAYRNEGGNDVVFASCGNLDVDESTLIFKAGTAQSAASAANWVDLTVDDPVLQSWTPRLGRVSLAIAPSDPDVIYAIGADYELNDFLVLARSTLGGDAGTWTEQSAWNNSSSVGSLLFTNPYFAAGCGGGASFFSQGWYDNAIAVDPADSDRVWVGGIDLFRSDDGGVDFGAASFWWADPSDPGSASNYAHADQHFLGFAAGKLYVGNDGGLFRADNPSGGTLITSLSGLCTVAGGVQFTNLNNGYEVTQFYYGAVFPDDTQYFGGTQDNGTILGADGSPNAWTEILGGDGGAVAVDPVDPSILYAENTGLSISKCTGFPANCQTDADWNDATAGINGDNGFLFIAPFIMDPSAAVDDAARQRLWTGGNYVWRTVNGAASWQKASAKLASGLSVSALAVAPSNPNFVLAGTAESGSAGGTIYRTTSGLTVNGASWPSRKPRTGYVSSLTFDPLNANVAYATYSTFGGVHVWKSSDAGANWSALDGTGANKIPDVPVHSIVVDPTNSSHLYVGTDIGIFVTVDGGLNWARENTGFGSVITEQLVVNGANLYAFTHGRGVYRVPLSSATQTVVVEFEQAKSEPLETAGNQIVTVRVRTSNHAALASTVTVDFLATEGTAKAGTDYTAPSPNPDTLTFPSGSTLDGDTQAIVIPIENDLIGEPAQSFTLTLQNATGALIARRTHTITIPADGDPPGISAGDVTLTEGNSGTTNAVFKLILSGPALAGTTVTYQTSAGTAIAGTDYVQVGSTTVGIPTGAMAANVSVPVIGDTVAETSKTFFLNLTASTANVTIDDAQGQATILDNDVSGTVELSMATYPVTEKGPAAKITLKRTGGVASGVAVMLQTQDGSARVADGDYQATAVSVGFAAGATTATVLVPITNDTIDEPAETVLVRIFGASGLGTVLGPRQTAVLNITDDDVPGQVKWGAATYTVAEGGGIDLKLMRASGAASAVTVNYVVTGTATGGGTDHTLAAGTATFGAAETTKLIHLDAVADGSPEGNETVVVTLSSPGGGAVLGTLSATVVTITDLEPTFAFTAANVSVKESASSIVLTVRRTGPLTTPASVDFGTVAGTALAGDDFDALTGTLLFANRPTATLTIKLRPDVNVEPDQAFQVTLTNPSPGMLLGNPGTETVTLTVTNDDFAGTFSFSAPSISVAESKPSVALTVKRTIPPGGTAAPTTIQYATADGTATSGSDYTGTGGSAPLAFLAGKTTATLTIPLLPDTVGEGDETLAVNLTSGGPDGGVLGAPASILVKILDDDVRATFGAATYAPKEPATGVTNLVIPVKRVGPAGTAFTAAYTVGGTATSPADFLLSPASPLSFGPSDLVKNLTLAVVPDADAEGPQTVILTLTSPDAGLGAIPITTVTITDEEPVIAFAAPTYKFNEPSSSGFATIYVKRTGNLNLGSQVSYTINAGTAQDGADFNAAGATPASPLTFFGGQSSLQIRVPLLPDTEDEDIQSFTIVLSSPSPNTSLGALSTTTVNLNDNDVAGKIILVGTQWSVTEGMGSAILTLTRSGGSASGASVVCQTGTGSATPGTDYTATAQTVTFGAGQTSATCTIPITQDGDSEGFETVPVSLASPSFGVILGASSGTLFIVDDE